MMSLFSGPAVIIDDNIGTTNPDQINALIAEIKGRSIPCAMFDDLPDNADDFAKNLEGVSFLILDWELRPMDLRDQPDVRLPDTWSALNITFLQSIMGKVFLPIFIFTSEDISSIKDSLTAAGIYDPNGNNLIFIQNKSSLVGGSLFTQIEDWTKNTSSVYVLKEWEREYKKAKNGLFVDFYRLSHTWPKILWKTYTEDGNPNMSLGDMITRNLYTRMSPFEFDESTINIGPVPTPDRAQLQRVLEGERFLTNLSPNDRAPGDLFPNPDAQTSTAYPYLLNIRNVCDTARDPNPYLYLLKGKVINTTDSSSFTFSQGHFTEQQNNAIVGCIHDGKVIEFNFRNLVILKWNPIKASRYGRILPPFITRIQQKYALYLQREGVSPLPPEAYDFPAPTGASTEPPACDCGSPES